MKNTKNSKKNFQANMGQNFDYHRRFLPRKDKSAVFNDHK